MFKRRTLSLIMILLLFTLGLPLIFAVTTPATVKSGEIPARPCIWCEVPAAAQSLASVVSGTLKKWHPVTIDFTGPFAQETDDAPNPFLDYRLTVIFTGPQGQVYEVPGFFAGDGQGNGSGDVWRVIFSPDEVGTWDYFASFRIGTDIAVDLNPGAGLPFSFNGESGQFSITQPGCDDPGFLRWGRLMYVGNHYLKFADGGYWIKGGTNSPENFLAYTGFDNTIDQGGLVPNFLHQYAEHVPDWREGDPNFVSANTGQDGKGIIGVLNYLAQKHVNSIYFLPMNLGGDGQEVSPFIGYTNDAYNKTHYDISKLAQWRIVFDYAQHQGIALHIVLAETEPPNELWLDQGELGIERKLFYRELIARFGYLLAVKWNLSEENDYSVAQLQAFAAYIRALDWAQHPLGVHTHLDDHSDYVELEGNPHFTTTSFQYTSDMASMHVDMWRNRSTTAGQPWVLDMDENFESLTSWNEDELRKRVLYPVYFSGGNIEWYLGYHNLPLGGDMRLENYRTREKMWHFMWYARRFMYDHLPFWQMIGQDQLLTGENESKGPGQVFTKPGVVYGVFLPVAKEGGLLDLTAASGTFSQRWYNPRVGQFMGETSFKTAGQVISLGLPPTETNEDWVILLEQVHPAAHYQGIHETYLPFVITKPCAPAPSP